MALTSLPRSTAPAQISVWMTYKTISAIVITVLMDIRLLHAHSNFKVSQKQARFIHNALTCKIHVHAELISL